MQMYVGRCELEMDCEAGQCMEQKSLPTFSRSPDFASNSTKLLTFLYHYQGLVFTNPPPLVP